MTRRSFLNTLLAGAVAPAFLPGAGRSWKRTEHLYVPDYPKDKVVAIFYVRKKEISFVREMEFTQKEWFERLRKAGTDLKFRVETEIVPALPPLLTKTYHLE